MTINSTNNVKNAESNLFKPQTSNRLTTGNKINEISKAKLKGINMALAVTKTAKRPKIKANTKNNF